jgi:hypothetical protein
MKWLRRSVETAAMTCSVAVLGVALRRPARAPRQTAQRNRLSASDGESTQVSNAQAIVTTQCQVSRPKPWGCQPAVRGTKWNGPCDSISL